MSQSEPSESESNDEIAWAVRLLAAESALQTGRTEDAERDYMALVNLDSSRPEGFAGLALVAGASKQFDLSLERWLDCFARFPTNPAYNWRMSLGWALLHTQRLDEAGGVFESLAGDYPLDFRPLVGLAYCAMRLRDWAGASVAWDRLLGEFPAEQQPDWSINRARCLENEGRLEEAETAYGKLQVDYPDQWSEIAYGVRLRAAERALRAGRTEDAEREYMALVNQDPSRPEGFAGLALAADSSKRFNLSRERWLDCFARFPSNPPYEWRMFLGWALLNTDGLDEAGRVFEALARDYPHEFKPLVGIAYRAMKLGEWASASAAWNRLIADFPAAVKPDWLINHANCLEAEGRLGDAAAIYDKLQAAYPDHHEARRSRERYRLKVAWSAIHAGDLASARQGFRAAIAAADSVASLEEIFANLPSAFEGWDRTCVWLEVERRLAEIASGSSGDDAAGLEMRIRLALRDYDGFIELLRRPRRPKRDRWFERFDRIAPLLRANAKPDYDAEKVFGIGLPRTGTSSLVAALEAIDFHAAHLVNYFTGEWLRLEDAFIFDAMADISTCLFFESAYHMFPNAKFIYTTRPMDDWLRSMENHEARLFGAASLAAKRRQGHGPALLALSHGRGDVRLGAQHRQVYGVLWAQHRNNREMRAAYERRVRNFFAANDPRRCIEFDVFSGDGWEKLCPFVGRGVPGQAFPHENRDPLAMADEESSRIFATEA